VGFLHYVPNLVRLKFYRSLLNFHTVFRIAVFSSSAMILRACSPATTDSMAESYHKISAGYELERIVKRLN